MKWNSIELSESTKEIPLEGHGDIEHAAAFMYELSDFEAEEWRRILMIRIGKTLDELNPVRAF